MQFFKLIIIAFNQSTFATQSKAESHEKYLVNYEEHIEIAVCVQPSNEIKPTNDRHTEIIRLQSMEL